MTIEELKNLFTTAFSVNVTKDPENGDKFIVMSNSGRIVQIPAIWVKAYLGGGTSSGDGGTCGCDSETVKRRLSDLEAKVFPLVVSYVGGNYKTYEVGTSVTPSATLSLTVKGLNVAESCTVKVSKVGGSSDAGAIKVMDGNRQWEASSAISSGSVVYNTKVTHDSVTVDAGNVTWSWTYYRYCGVFDAEPADVSKAVADNLVGKGVLTTSTSLSETVLAAGKCFLFVVYGTHNLVVRDYATGGLVSGCTKGTVLIPRENDKSIKNTYSYIIAPASGGNWRFYINAE